MAIGLLLIVAGCFALPYDLSVATWFLTGAAPDVLTKMCCLAEAFAHGFGAAAVLLAIYLLDLPRRRALWRLAAMSLGVGVMADLVKLLLSRHRPYHFDFLGGPEATFVDWLPGWSGGAALQSFPSSHSAVAAGLTVGLGWLYPRGKWLFICLAALALGQRMVVGAHFLSDVLWGAGLGALLAGACLCNTPLGRWFDRRESDHLVEPGAAVPEEITARHDIRAA